jgi:phosphatidylethanolamine-binding protein (PEBP) family uncharacterized protein
MLLRHRLAIAFILSLPTLGSAQPSGAAPAPTAVSVAVQLTGGFETDPRDHGRPVVLVAAALGVSSDVFRDAFSEVHPAPAGEQPQPDQVRRNKAVLMEKLGPLGVTDDRLNEVSNYYRYPPGSRELWRHKPASATAQVVNGVVTGITIVDPGAGYTSAPVASIPDMPQVQLKATLALGRDLATNGAIKEITIVPPAAADKSTGAPAPPASSFVLHSPAVGADGMLPVEFTGDGSGVSPPLEWTGAPSGTKSFALIMHHIDREGETKWYWTLYNIPASATSLPKAATGIGTAGNNSIDNRIGYAPPHSKGPGPRTYVLTLYALSALVDPGLPPEQVDRAKLLAAMQGKTLATAELKVVYDRSAGE